jgi:hydroxypyruvate isomerase
MPTRRTFLKSSLAATIVTGAPSFANAKSQETGSSPETMSPIPRKNRIHQSVSRWCYKNIPLDQLCQASAQMGLKGVDLLEINEWDVPHRYGLICTMGYAGGGTIPDALNRTENHDAIEAAFRKNIPIAAKAGVPNVITFSGNRRGMSDDEGARNTILGLNRLKKIAEDNGVNICMELLNSKHDHHDYMCDHTAWGVRVLKEVDSPRIKLLYDIYHMQIMEGDLITTIRENIQYLGHFHTGGVPGRHELDNTQEITYVAVMNAIADLNFSGYVAHEFVPAHDPLTSLRQAVDLCDV